MANQNQAPPNRALAVPTKEERLARLPGAYRDPKAITERLQYAAANFHLVSPATACGTVPEGCSISLSTVLVDAANETYDVGGGKVGLAKVALDKIAAGAGISWDARQSGRLDDGSDPNYCAWRAVGRMRHLDGTEVQLVATKEMDLRDGSPQVIALEERARGARPPRDPAKQIREMRLHIMAHAETKARLRAIRSIGIRAAYAAKELEKPFVVAKLQWTGQSDDPELRRAFALKQADAMLGGSRALYGDAPTPPPAAVSMLGASRPPPVGRSSDEDEYEPPPARLPNGAPMTIDAPPPTPKPDTPRPAATTQAAQPPAPQPAPSGAREPSGVVLKFGKTKGTPIEEASDRDLQWYGEVLEKSVDDPEKSRFRATNERELAALRAEVAYRGGGAPAPAAAAPTTGGGGGSAGDFQGDYNTDDEIPFIVDAMRLGWWRP